MRFCLSLTAHYSILHLTGSASFTDDPFNKCFSEKFLLAENVEFFNVFVCGVTQKNLGEFSCFSVFDTSDPLHVVRWQAPFAASLTQKTQAYDDMSKNKGSGRRFRTNGSLCVSVPKKSGRWSEKNAGMHGGVLVRAAEGARWHLW